MPVRLFVGNLPYDVTEPDLREFFSSVGPLSTVIIPVDRETGKRRGFAFVEFSDPAQAAEASRKLNNQPFKGRNITINEARARESRPDSGPGARPGYSMRPAGASSGSRPNFTPRPGFAPRPSFGTSDFAQNPMENGRSAGRGERRSRNFGPDAKPARKRKTNYGTKTEMGFKRGPIPERSGGQIFGGYEDDHDDDLEIDYMADLKNSDEEDAV
jgi:RNA recognition motif-containing protein